MRKEVLETKPRSLEERGRQIYISEGCIHCHSQYVRPHSSDELRWGPATDVAVRSLEQPPLIGNRRQGPDLTEIGNRRSSLWLRAHFMDPASVSRDSPMPSYARLFADDRGEALLAYVKSLGAKNLSGRLDIQMGWRLPDPTFARVRSGAGLVLVETYCATCHWPNGTARQKWKSEFRRLPPDFRSGPYVYAPIGTALAWRLHRIAQIIKFGLPGTDMPGHEYLSDQEIAALATQIASLAGTNDHVFEFNGESPSPHIGAGSN